MVECVTVENSHYYTGNPLYEQHKLRFQSIIKRQNWDVPYVKNMEYDNYDNPAAYYLIKRNGEGKAVGVSRLCSTEKPYMLEEHFPHLITKAPLPKSKDVWETTRFCVDSSLSPQERKQILHHLVVAHLEFAIANNIKQIVAVTYPVFWKNIFINSGWPAEWLGNVHKSKEGFKMIAGRLKVSKMTLDNVRAVTGIQEPILDFRDETSQRTNTTQMEGIKRA